MDKKIRALSVGAVLWDVIGDQEYIGGAPYNVAVNLKKLGAESMFVTRVGNDERGDRAVEEMRRCGVGTGFVQRDPVFPTGVALATLDGAGNASYEIPHASFDEICLTEKDINALNAFAPDVVCFGSFEQRCEKSRLAVRSVLERVRAKTVFFDVNIRMGFCEREVFDFCFRHTDVLKLNEDECALLSFLLYGEKMEPAAFGKKTIAEYGVSVVLVTLGAAGCFVCTEKAQASVPTEPVKSADTIGAGDAFSGAFLYAYLSGKDPVSAAKCGNALGAYVAQRTGALPAFDQEIVARLEKMTASED